MADKRSEAGLGGAGKPHFANYAPGFANRFVSLPGRRTMMVGVGAAIVVATVAGAFGTGNLDSGRRLLFWTLVLGSLAALWRAWFALTVTRSDQWYRAVWLGIVPVTLPLPLVLHLALLLVGGSLRSDWWRVWPSGFAIAAAAAAALFAVGRRAVEATGTPAKGRLFRHGVLDPARLRRAIAEDHYVRLVFDDGRSVLVHDRFATLAEELAALDGAFARRGHWIAASNLKAIRRDGRRLLLDTLDGSTVAVSPGGRDELLAKGWIARRGVANPPGLA